MTNCGETESWLRRGSPQEIHEGHLVYGECFDCGVKLLHWWECPKCGKSIYPIVVKPCSRCGQPTWSEIKRNIAMSSERPTTKEKNDAYQEEMRVFVEELCKH